MTQMHAIHANETWLVAGLGVSGVSAVRYLHARGARVIAADSRIDPPGAEQARGLATLALGHLEPGLLSEHQTLTGVIASPGLPYDLPLFCAARDAGLRVISDIELFAEAVNAMPAAPKVIGVTGSNGKSTVCTLLGDMGTAAGVRTSIGGNLGRPALDLLDDAAELIVLELSSFQLEATETLRCDAATVLNISPDHIDRHGTLDNYASIKETLLERTEVAVLNTEDAVVSAMQSAGRVVTFGIGGTWTVQPQEAGLCLMRDGECVVLDRDLQIIGRHNLLNALAALALGDAVGLPLDRMRDALQAFTGLPHRCALVGIDNNDIRWVNDSKGTNVGATEAALAGLDGPIVLLAGGQAKGGDFSPLRKVLSAKCRAVVLFGQDANLIEQQIDGAAPSYGEQSLEAAVTRARELAEAGDTVLLSPGCASLDQFENFAVRGDAFEVLARQGAGMAMASDAERGAA